MLHIERQHLRTYLKGKRRHLPLLPIQALLLLAANEGPALRLALLKEGQHHLYSKIILTKQEYAADQVRLDLVTAATALNGHSEYLERDQTFLYI